MFVSLIMVFSWRYILVIAGFLCVFFFDSSVDSSGSVIINPFLLFCFTKSPLASVTEHTHIHKQTHTCRRRNASGRSANECSGLHVFMLNYPQRYRQHTHSHCIKCPITQSTHTNNWCCLLNRDGQKRKMRSKEKDIVGLWIDFHTHVHTQIPPSEWLCGNHRRTEPHGMSCYTLCVSLCMHGMKVCLCRGTVGTRLPPGDKGKSWHFRVKTWF